MDHKAILENRARIIEEKIQPPEGNPDPEEIAFAMRDLHHDFSMDLSTVLRCLRIAEIEGGVPEIPESWWTLVAMRYKIPLIE